MGSSSHGRTPGARGRRGRRRCISPGLALLFLGLHGCSGGGGAPPGDGELYVVSCSLGCSSAGEEPGAQLGCGISTIGSNQEIAVELSEPVDPASLSGETFQVTDLSTGATPPGVFRVDPANPRRVLYRPALSFDSQGLPVFGLTPGRTYRLVVPGTEQDAGDDSTFLRSVTGRPNRSRLACSVVASEALVDVVPGPPSVSVFLDLASEVDPDTGEVLDVTEAVLANGGVLLEDVYRRTRVRLEFDDVMNPATLLNPFSGDVAFLSVSIDPDGDLEEGVERVPVVGTWQLALDQTARRTTVVFDPVQDLPSAGSEDPPRLLVVELPEEVRDLGGHSLANGGLVGAVPERREFGELRLPGDGGETFDAPEREDARRTSALWTPAGLAPGPGGGTGALGDLVVELEDGLVVLNTDHQTFESPSLLGRDDPLTGVPATEIEVTDGVFEFARLRVGPGAILRFEGSRPARVFVRGEAVIDGTLDLRGSDAPDHPSMPCDPLLPEGDGFCYPSLLVEEGFRGGPGAPGGPGGGPGGRGGDLPTGDPSLLAIGGLESPLEVIDLDGRAGSGIPDPSSGAPLAATGGHGGTHWPLDLPTSATDLAGLAWGFFECGTYMLGAGGGGGGYATPGAPSVNGRLNYQVFVPVLPDPTPGGQAVGWVPTGPGPDPRTLDPESGYLRGGSGGGGGGSHVGDTHNDEAAFMCDEGTFLELYRPASSAGGGGGGGAIQVQSGRLLSLAGRIDVSGGDGGGAIVGVSEKKRDALDRAAPGGGGSGGAVLLQAPDLRLGPFGELLNVEGGRGARGVPDPFPDDGLPLDTFGGDGGAGAVRLEGADLDFGEAAGTIAPGPDEIGELHGAPAMEDVLSIGPFETQTRGPGAVSAGQSCWFTGEGSPFVLRPLDDGPEGLGWDMEVFVAGVGPVSWRTPGALFAGASLEELLGNELGASPIVSRFQGARVVAPLGDPCEAPLDGPSSPFLAGSVSPWVRHPAEIVTLADEQAELPTHLRFQVLFDASAELAPFLLGVTELWIRAQPD